MKQHSRGRQGEATLVLNKGTQGFRWLQPPRAKTRTRTTISRRSSGEDRRPTSGGGKKLLLAGPPWWRKGQESTSQRMSLGSMPGLGRSPGKEPTPVFLPGEFHGQTSLAGYSPRGRKELDTAERLNNNDIPSRPARQGGSWRSPAASTNRCKRNYRQSDCPVWCQRVILVGQLYSRVNANQSSYMRHGWQSQALKPDKFTLRLQKRLHRGKITLATSQHAVRWKNNSIVYLMI